MTDIVERLRKPMVTGFTHPIDAERAEAADEIERLQAENEDLRRWKAMDKPITAAMAVVNNDVVALRAEIERLQADLTIIAAPNKARTASAALSIIEAMQGVARRALEPKP